MPFDAINMEEITEARRKAIAKSIRTANLAARGVTRVDAGGDVTVAYLVITGDNVSTTAIRDYFGYGDDLGDLHDRAHDAYMSKKHRDHFEAGTLLIDEPSVAHRTNL